MELKDLLVLYDGVKDICIKDNNLNCIYKGDIWNPRLYDFEHREVISFGFYDNELYVKVE